MGNVVRLADMIVPDQPAAEPVCRRFIPEQGSEFYAQFLEDMAKASTGWCDIDVEWNPERYGFIQIALENANRIAKWMAY